MNRIESLDFLRGLTILFMIEFHIYIYLFQEKFKSFKIIISFFGFIAAPLFLIISGFSYILFIEKFNRNLFNNKKIISEIIKRAIFIFTVNA
ncbi:MAG: heparan-alpha-glucosaminide N-acetyltransferase domain-containing protein [Promethearchaeia archaeon]